MFVIIPARYDSTRLPGKPLLDISGKTLIQRVYECAQSSDASHVVVATDDERIEKTVKEFGGEVCMTSSEHRSGTDRIAEVIDTLGLSDSEIVVNLQGDEPGMPGTLINQVASILETNQADMGTACHLSNDSETFLDPNVVKVVLDENNNALYFSRAPIPFDRTGGQDSSDPAARFYWHMGIYAYRAEFIKRFCQWPPCPLEKVESLEQLRALHHGKKISVCVTNPLPIGGIDTETDLELARHWFSKNSK